MKDTRVVVPLVQTVFLPQNAMGVRYIDRVRTKVYVDNLSRPKKGPVCLQGFYELDLEYHGLEGQRLYKHRVMLPLRLQLPGDWRPCGEADFEAADLHCVITKPMLRILSPYVLEFGAGLAVEYVGDRACSKQEPEDSGITGSELLEEERRLESKFGRGLVWRAENGAENSADNNSENSNVTNNMKEKIEEKMNRLFWAEQTEQEKQREHSLPVWEPEETVTEAAEKVTETVGETAVEPEEYRLPVWAPRTESREAAKETVTKEYREVAKEDANEAIQEVAAVSDDTFEQKLKPVGSRVEPNMNRFRSMLTTAAISRLQAKGESLEAREQISEPINEQVRERIAESIKEQVKKDLQDDLNGELNNNLNSELGGEQEDNMRKNRQRNEQNKHDKQNELNEQMEIRELETSAPNSGEAVELKTVFADNSGDEPKLEVVSTIDSGEKAKVEAVSVNDSREASEIETVSVADSREASEIETVSVADSREASEIETVSAVDSGEDTEIEFVSVADSGEKPKVEVVSTIDSVEKPETEVVSAANSGEEAEIETVSAVDSGEESEAEAVSAADSGEAAVQETANRIMNGVSPVNSAGVRLRVGVRNGSEPAAAPKSNGGFSLKYYVVKPGDDPMSIALKHNVSLDKLRESNAGNRLEGELAVGTVLKIPV